MPFRPVRPILEVCLARGEDERASRVSLLGKPMGVGRTGFRRLDARLIQVVRASPEVQARVNAGGRVPHGDVIRALDSFQLAGVEDVVFFGAPPPSRRR